MCDTAGIDNQRASGTNIAASCRTSFLNNLLAPGRDICCVSFPAALDILRATVDISSRSNTMIINILCTAINYGISRVPGNIHGPAVIYSGRISFSIR
ncbi:hypothetical protein HmCmsJML284_02702 [Escherichia coli]|nr:Uncharacterised protein [Escherichia coli]GCP82009.1 hypothetical protein ExPECSC066_02067 [Escherichia coli]GCW24095.1 hypothetical protein HmCmsJML062_01472 [Escherichia coli]GCX60313.1 hypothetical protein HmCmsJML065_04463 [Escherichia coli]GDC46933.1 hypothetical protein HmCmsJML250_04491 [Escherichia coli]